MGLLRFALAASPIVLLLTLVLRGQRTARAATWVVVWVTVVGSVGFGATPDVLVVGVGKGLWLGTWILVVIWPALLLYRLAARGGIESIGGWLARKLPRRGEMLLLVAWIFPSFVQGVAGFGTPIAIAAPLLVAMGWSPIKAVALPLIGYHWSVTFGSMGASFFMASLVGGLDVAGQASLGLRAGTLLAVQCLAAGAIVLIVDGGMRSLRSGLRLLVLAGAPMAAGLIVVARSVPSVASLSAGALGLLVVLLLARSDRAAPDAPVDGATASGAPVVVTTGRVMRILSPYAILLLTALPVSLIPGLRAWSRGLGQIAPAFPATTTAMGWENPAVVAYSPILPLGHPGAFIASAVLLGALVYRLSGVWTLGMGRPMVAGWLRSLPAASAPVLLLGCVATLMGDLGMIALLAENIARAAGSAYPSAAPLVGGLGSFITGSTTASNALFAGLQSDVALRLGLAPYELLAAQTAGGNVGNAISPVILLVGATAVGAEARTGEILLAVLPAALVLFGVVIVTTTLTVLL